MRLHDLAPAKGSKKRKKRVGRGMASGNGKTSGRGHKGQKARSGGGVRPGFEGGQMPMQRRVPKRGFNNIFKKRYAIINIKDLAKFKENEKLDVKKLLELGVIKKRHCGLKVLGNGEINKKIEITAKKFSKSAEEKIKNAGGKVNIGWVYAKNIL